MALRIWRRAARSSISLVRRAVNLATGRVTEARIARTAATMTSSARVKPFSERRRGNIMILVLLKSAIISTTIAARSTFRRAGGLRSLAAAGPHQDLRHLGAQRQHRLERRV